MVGSRGQAGRCLDTKGADTDCKRVASIRNPQHNPSKHANMNSDFVILI